MSKNVLSHPIDFSLLPRKKRTLIKTLRTQPDLVPLKIFVASGSTTNEITDYLELFLLDIGVKPIIKLSDFNRYYEELIFPSDELLKFDPDVIYIHSSAYNIKTWPELTDPTSRVEKLISNELSKYNEIFVAVKNKFRATVVVNNFEFQKTTPGGHWETTAPGGSVRFISKLNEKFVELVSSFANIQIHDLNHFANYIGLKKFHSTRDFFSSHTVVAHEHIPEFAYSVAATIKSIFGKSRKLLILDLDNTLWGGIIGDDGVQNLSLDQGDALSEAYLDFQLYVKRLLSFGILLAVCSKNEYETAIQGLNSKKMILQESDFSVIKANWGLKSQNIIDALSEVNLLPSSAVFIDDNPVERYEVAMAIDEVEVLNVTSDITKFRDILDEARLFVPSSLTHEDKLRNRFYADDAKRGAAKNQHNNLADYLNKLEMRATFTKIDASNIKRCVQLFNKTNQFNFTGERISETALWNMVKDTDTVSFCVSLDDKFGPNGIVSVVVLNKTERAVLSLWNWVMSCRVFERGLEVVILEEVAKIAENLKVNKLNIRYCANTKNKYLRAVLNGSIAVFDKYVDETEYWTLDISKIEFSTKRIMEVENDQ